MRKILTSLLVIGMMSSGVFALSQAFFSDTETSTGNVLSAGSVDLQIGNTSFYNGEESTATSWNLDDIHDKLFFNFNDIKPGDWGQDTISLKVTSNPVWACADLTITKNDDNTCTDPERVNDPDCVENNNDLFDGELAQNIEFVFWLDDGDSIFDGEAILAQGTADQALNRTFTLADSLVNNLGGTNGNPMQPEQTYYIGKAWCFGEMEITNQNIICNGTMLDNATQTDVLEGDISFYAIQQRHNEGFVCEDLNLLWIIGDSELNQTDNPVDEFNFESLGNYPAGPYTPSYTRNITGQRDDVLDKKFPWNSDASNQYAKSIIINYDYSGPATQATLTLRWSPGISGIENKQIYHNDTLVKSIGPVAGISTSGWWSNYPMREDEYSFTLNPGSHVFRLEQTTGNGTVWDFIKLEKK